MSMLSFSIDDDARLNNNTLVFLATPENTPTNYVDILQKDSIT